jgi:rubrerythrin
MSLTTFGAVMGFAEKMTGRTQETYRTAAQKVKDPVFKEILQTLSADEAKNHSLMEKTRRENVTEMILEHVTGLQEEDYSIEPNVPGHAGDEEWLKIVLDLEMEEQKFFQDAASKISLPEVGRIFRKIAQKKEGTIEKLKQLNLKL